VDLYSRKIVGGDVYACEVVRRAVVAEQCVDRPCPAGRQRQSPEGGALSGIRLVPPVQRHPGQDPAILAQRQAVYEQAKRRPAERGAGPRSQPLP
jgi:hypothetical protein